MDFVELPEFKKEHKNLFKRFRSLNEDIKILKSFLEKFPEGFEPRIFRIGGLGIECNIFKVKKFRCKALKGRGANSGIRIIYSYFKDKNRIDFIEIYYKGDKKNHNKKRILEKTKQDRNYKMRYYHIADFTIYLLTVMPVFSIIQAL